MNTTAVSVTKPTVMAKADTRDGIALGASLAVVVYFWTINYNKLGTFYDYSTLTDAAGKLAAGLHPFRDYSSPVQSLSIWLAYGCELLFGHRFLALGYGNLILTVAMFLAIVYYARKAFSFPLALLVAMAVCVASTLQHAILWYDTMGVAFLAAISLKCADLLREQEIQTGDAVLLSALLLATGMTKMNFFADAICVIVFFTLVFAFQNKGLRNRKKAGILAALGVAVCAAPPFIESIVNRVALSTWLREVILKPAAERVGGLRFLINPAFYVMEINAWWWGTVLKFSVTICLLVYVFVGHAALKRSREEGGAGGEGRIVRAAMVGAFWLATMLLVVTNIDIESSSLCFCLVGLAAMGVSGQFRGERTEKRLRGATIALVVYFLVVGSVSMVRHSRMTNLINTFPGTMIPSDGEPAYFRGVELSPQATLRLAHINEVLDKYDGVPVYWGPGLEMMNRIHPGVTDPAFPLWYHANITVAPSDTPKIVSALDSSKAGLVFVSRLEYEFIIPKLLKQYLTQTWILEKKDDYIVAFRRPPSAPDSTDIR